jgi:very-short-patch-repair endonuclease
LALDSMGRPRGAARVRRALELHAAGSAGTRSGSEDRFQQGLRAAGLPEPQVNVRGATGHPALELDFVWQKQRLAVAIDGSQHEWAQAEDRDAAIDNMLESDHWLHLHIPTRRIWWDLSCVIREVQALLEQRDPHRARKTAFSGSRRA